MLSPYDYGKDALYDADTRALMQKITFSHGGPELPSSSFPEENHKIGTGKSLSIAKNHPKPSQEFSERFGPFIHKMKGFRKNSRQKKFTRTSPKSWEDKFLGIPFLASTKERNNLYFSLSAFIFGNEGKTFKKTRNRKSLKSNLSWGIVTASEDSIVRLFSCQGSQQRDGLELSLSESCSS